MRTPVAFFIFNRPDTTARVFEAIRQAGPSRLLIVADGPRANRPGEAEKCAAARAVVAGVDWPCEVSINFSDINLGCKRRISTGLGWVFENVEEAVILEDDCLPDQSFFRFCEELLDKFRGDRRVEMISGNNFQFGAGTMEESYYFSRRPHIWGWATWRRSWEHYDVDMKIWPKVRDEGWLDGVFPEKTLARYWRHIFDDVHSGRIDTWDYQFAFCCMLRGGLCVMPTVNLVSNIGFRDDATHTTKADKHAEIPTQSMQFPLKHADRVSRNVELDAQIERELSLPLSRMLGLQGVCGGLVAKVRALLHR